MIKKMFGKIMAIALVAGVLSPLSAQDTPGVEAGIDFSSTYIWRGSDALVVKQDAAGDAREFFNFAPVVMPSFTVNTPIEGLSFNIWASYALMARANADGALRAADEIDFSGTYEFDTTMGGFGFTYVLYAFPTTMGSYYSYGEVIGTYTIPVLLNPTFSIAASDGSGGSYEYLTAGISHAIEFGSMSLEPSLTFGWWYYNTATNANWGHIDVALPFSISVGDNLSFHITPLLVYRIFADGDTQYLDPTGSLADRPSAIGAVTIGASLSF
ncbi:MAG: hypothetical protein ABUK01_14215 [Leptospirales bacterium]